MCLQNSYNPNRKWTKCTTILRSIFQVQKFQVHQSRYDSLGEGEVKLFEFVNSKHETGDSFLFYGSDSDMVLLGMYLDIFQLVQDYFLLIVQCTYSKIQTTS